MGYWLSLQVFCPVGPVNREYEDSRKYQDATIAGVKRYYRQINSYDALFYISWIYQQKKDSHLNHITLDLISSIKCPCTYLKICIKRSSDKTCFAATSKGVSWFLLSWAQRWGVLYEAPQGWCKIMGSRAIFRFTQSRTIKLHFHLHPTAAVAPRNFE